MTNGGSVLGRRWNIRRREILAAAFPDTPWVWVQRDPVRVLASLLADPPGWLRSHPGTGSAVRRFGLDPAEVADMPRAEFAARALGAMLEAAADAADPAGRLCVDHAALPDAVWQGVAPHFGLETDPAAIARMMESPALLQGPGGPGLCRRHRGEPPGLR